MNKEIATGLMSASDSLNAGNSVSTTWMSNQEAAA